MTKTRKYSILGLAVGGVIVFASIYQNCTGTRSRSADLDVSLQQALNDVQSLSCTSDAVTTNFMAELKTMGQQDGSQVYYAKTPGSMGLINLVAPLNYAALRDDGGSTPVQVFAYFVLNGDGTGVFELALSDSGAASSTSAPAATACSSTMQGFTINTVVAAGNDGSNGLQLAAFSDSEFDMELNLRGSTILHIHSNDVDDGSLPNTILLEVYQVDPTTGEDNSLGVITLTQPD